MFHNETAQDNLTRTFQYPSTHDSFWVAGRNIGANACPTLKYLYEQ